MLPFLTLVSLPFGQRLLVELSVFEIASRFGVGDKSSVFGAVCILDCSYCVRLRDHPHATAGTSIAVRENQVTRGYLLWPRLGDRCGYKVNFPNE